MANRFWLWTWLGLGGLLAGCVAGGRELTPTAVPTATAGPATATAAVPTPTSAPGGETPSLTPVWTPTATSTPVAVPTPTPTVPQATSTPAAAPTRVVPLPDAVTLPAGFGISVFEARLQGPRMMTLDPTGELVVAERGAGRVVRLPDRDRDGVADGREVLAEGLRAPSSVAYFTDGSLYVAETTRVLRLSVPDSQGRLTKRDVIIEGLPSGGHSTRTLLFSPDGEWLFVSIGSSCNVCQEEDPRRAAIVRYRPDGSGETLYAWGLRNAVGITIRPGTAELWATNNGRDSMGDDVPPETVNLVREGDDFGWPRCQAGRIEDPDLGGPGSCAGVAAPAVEMQAHSAPLGLVFYTGEQFPAAYRGNLFVAFHGSWNRGVPTGYKVVRIPVDSRGRAGAAEDFATGWLQEGDRRWGRPVDVVVARDGSLLVSDDEGGRIYRIFYYGTP